MRDGLDGGRMVIVLLILGIAGAVDPAVAEPVNDRTAVGVGFETLWELDTGG